MPSKNPRTPKRDIIRAGHRPKPGSKTHATKKQTARYVEPYTPLPRPEDYDLLPWDEIFELGVK